MLFYVLAFVKLILFLFSKLFFSNLLITIQSYIKNYKDMALKPI